MDFWKSDYEDVASSSVLGAYQNLEDSPNISKDDSFDYNLDDASEPNEPLDSSKKTDPKLSFMAKKRLQAYTGLTKPKSTPNTSNNKELTRTDSSSFDKTAKSTPKKAKKLYPDEARKATIRDIENLKSMGYGGGRYNNVRRPILPPLPLPLDHISVAIAKVPVDQPAPAVALTTVLDEENLQLFRKRDIKCRSNLRQSDTLIKRSPSPIAKEALVTDNYEKSNERSKKKPPKDYPKNWTEYKEMDLDPSKDAILKNKFFKKNREKKFEFKKYFNFETPSTLTETYKCQPIEGDALYIPFSYIRSTATSPRILYSTNHRTTSPGFLTKTQLFALISSEKKALIEKLWKPDHRVQPSSKKISARKWYPRNWKKFENLEGKLLEKSIGLSFLQNYSDQEEEDEQIEEANDESIITAYAVDNLEDNLRSATPEAKIIKDYDKKSKELDHKINKYDEDKKLKGIEKEIEHTGKQVKEVIQGFTQNILSQNPEEIEPKRSVGSKNIENDFQLEKEHEENAKDTHLEKKHKEVSCKKVSDKETVKTRDTKNENIKDIIKEDLKDEDKEPAPKKKEGKSRWKGSEDSLKDDMKDNDQTTKKDKKLGDKNLIEVMELEDEKEEGEVDSIEGTPKVANPQDEYEKTKRELEMIEEALKETDAKLLLQEGAIEKSSSKKKKKKKVKEEEIKTKDKKKRLKRKMKKKQKEESEESSESSESEEEITKKKKQKKKRKRKKEKEDKKEKRRDKNKRTSKRKKDYIESEEDSGHQEESTKKKKKKRKEIKKKKNRSTSKDSEKSHVKKGTLDVSNENYEDDLKYFEDRFELDGKGKKHRKDEGKLNEILEKYSKDQDKRESRWESSDSEGFLSPKINKEKPEDVNKDKQKEKHNDSEKLNDISTQKDIIKVDLLKMNENYLREQDKLKAKLKSEERRISESSNKSRDSQSKVVEKEYEDLREKIIEKKDKKIACKDISESEGNKETTQKKLKERSKSRDKDRSRRKSDNFEVVDVWEYEEDAETSKEKPDWEKIKSKRKRHVFDTLHDKSEKKSKYSDKNKIVDDETGLILNIKQEKEDFYDFGSANLNKSINTSWESDDEVTVTNIQECSRSFSKTSSKDSSFSLEIPLNIKHVPRKIKIEPDLFEIEMPESKKANRDLSAERKRLEVEKLRVRELERELNEAQEVEFQKRSGSKTKRGDNEIESEVSLTEVQTPIKKGRWDIRGTVAGASTPIIKVEKSEDVIDVDGSNSNPPASLENEYEEFLRAVTSSEKKNCINLSNKPILIESSSDSSVHIVDERLYRHKSKTDKAKSVSSFKNVITNLDELTSHPVETKPALDIPVIQIPLPPVKTERIKPVPVPSPKLEAVIDLNKPLINLSLSANVTQNITLSLATSVPSITAPITSSIDIPKTSFEISTPVSKNTVINVKDVPNTQQIIGATNLSSGDSNSPHISSIVSKHSLVDSILPQSTSAVPNLTSEATECGQKIFDPSATKQKIVFTTLTLPTKKLINNSNLNLDDSDNDDQFVLEEMKRKKLEALIADNKREIQVEETQRKMEKKHEKETSDAPKEEVLEKSSSSKQESKEKEAGIKKTSPHRSSHSRRDPSPRRRRESPTRKRDSPTRKRDSPTRKKDSPARKRDSSPSRRRESSPKRRSSPRRRSPRRSPRRKSPTRRSSPRRRSSPGRRGDSPRKRRSVSPRNRQSTSPKRRRSISPRDRKSPRRNRSSSPRGKKRSVSPREKGSRSEGSLKKDGYKSSKTEKENSPISSPLEGLKRSIADSTISDDQLPQSTTIDDYGEHIFATLRAKNQNPGYESPKRIPLDVRISQVLGEPAPQPITTITTTGFNYDNQQQYHQNHYEEHYKMDAHNIIKQNEGYIQGNQAKKVAQSTFKQVGNMLQIVPSDDIVDIPVPAPSQRKIEYTNQAVTKVELKPNIPDVKSKILQRGNMLEIVPSEIVHQNLISAPGVRTEVKIEKTEDSTLLDDSMIESPLDDSIQENNKSSPEAMMLQKVAERRAEREKRRLEKERRRIEKEKKKKERDKVKQEKIKVKTENMIKRALEMEDQDDDELDDDIRRIIQWPPVNVVISQSKDVGKSILVKGGSRKFEELLTGVEKKPKIVSFADGIRPGEGTSPSGGEELMSPPPPTKKKLPKEKRYKKTKFGKKSKKKKIKIVKKPPSPEESDSEDNLPPPSPPPGSPPPHIFPPRIKLNPINNVPAAYLATIIQNAQQQQQQHLQQQQYESNLYRPPINLLMAPPPPPQTHPPPSPQNHLPPQGSLHQGYPPPSPQGQGHLANQGHLSAQGHAHQGYPPPSPQGQGHLSNQGHLHQGYSQESHLSSAMGLASQSPQGHLQSHLNQGHIHHQNIASSSPQGHLGYGRTQHFHAPPPPPPPPLPPPGHNGNHGHSRLY